MFEFCKQFARLQFLLIIVALIVGIYYPHLIEFFKSTTPTQITKSKEPGAVPYKNEQGEEKLFTKEELRKYNGEDGAPIYLALLGSVYDVSKGKKHYGPGCSYNFFVGRDASVSFITGEFDKFTELEADDVVVLKPSDLLGLANWKLFYDKDYIYKGKLIGRFYDATGTATTYNHKYLALVETAREAKVETEHLRLLYPDCNIEWSVEKGTRVWCTTTSGGKEREWVGHPRKLFEVGSDSFRCACIQQNELETTSVMIKSYENCEQLAHECYYNID